MAHRRIACGRRLAFEALEGRTLLSGNVTATLVGNTLRIRGDAASNVVQLAQVIPVGYSALGGDDVAPDRLFAIPTDSTNTIAELDPDTGAEINRFAAPEAVSQGPDGLAFDGTSLYYINGFGTQQLWQLNPDTGAVIDVDPVPGGSGNYDGLAAVGGKIYILDFGLSDIIEFDPVSDTPTNVLDIDVLNPGYFVTGGLAGITGPNALIATANFGFDGIVEIDPTTGLITSSFAPAQPAYYGVAVVDGSIYLGSPAGFIDVYSRAGELQTTLTSPSPFQVSGVATLINGSLQTLSFDVAPANIDVQLAGGADSLVVDNLSLSGKLSVTDTGNGNDSVAINFSSLGGPLSIDTSAGSDSVTLSSVTVAGSVGISTGSDNDNVLLEGASAGGSLSVDTAAGNDLVQVVFSGAGGALGISTAAGKDFVDVFFADAASTTIDTGADDDSLSLQFLSTGSLRASTGAGFDVVTVSSVQDTSGTGLIDGGANTDVYIDDGSSIGFKKKNFP